MNKWWAWVQLILCNLFWAGNYVVGKYIVMDISSFWITLIRWGLAVICLLPMAYIFEKPDWKSVKKYWFSLACMGALGVIGFSLLCYSALMYTSPTNAAFVEALIPALLAIFSVIIFREKISYPQVTGILLSFLGVLVILTEGNLGKILFMQFNKGDLLMLVAVLAWTFYSLIGKKVEVPPMTTTAVSSGFGLVMLIPFAFLQPMDFGQLTAVTVTGVLYMAIFALVISYIFWNHSVKLVGPTQAGVFLNLVPIFTVGISVLLGETITLSQISGGLLVLTGVYLTTGMFELIIYSRWKTRRNQSEY